MKKHDADVIVVGGGLGGLTLTALLAAAGVRTICLDREAPPMTLSTAFDGRTTAVSYGSRLVLERAGIWEMLAPASCAIQTIQISDGDSPVLLEFTSREAGGKIFGWIAENLAIRRALYDRVAALPAARHIAPATVADFAIDASAARTILADGRTFTARLIVGADGRNSFTREWMGIGARQWSYRQRAIVCCALHDNPHNHIAVENFRPEGPFALLPMTDAPDGSARSSIVWTEHGAERDSALHYDEKTFNAALNARFPVFYGAARLTGGRFSYPLGLVHAHNYIAPRMALIADAAHGIHPIAGQGLNLGFRDIDTLAALVTQAITKNDDPGDDALLAAYQRQRRADNMAMAGATDILTRLFSNDLAPVRLARRAGLRAVAHMPFAKRFFMSQAMGSPGLLSSLVQDAKAA